ncbi:MAG: tetratricopeptide repeat protein [Myxococcota bacterium]
MGKTTRWPIAVMLGALILTGSVLSGCATASSKAMAKQNARKARSHFEIAADHLNNGRDAHGLREMLLAAQFDPRNARIHMGLAVAYKRKGRIEEAERELRQVLELHPPYHDARLLLSNLYIHLERYEDALTETRALLDDPTFPGVWRALTNQGWARFRLGRNAEARGDLELALEYRQNYGPAMLNLGILEAQEGHHLEAIARFGETLEHDPRPGAQAEANYRIAELYVSMGQRERAVAHLVAAVDQAVSGPWGTKSEDYLKILR